MLNITIIILIFFIIINTDKTAAALFENVFLFSNQVHSEHYLPTKSQTVLYKIMYSLSFLFSRFHLLLRVV